MGWEVLDQWGGDVVRVDRLSGGVANDVWSLRVHGQRAVGRLGSRSDADLVGETELLRYLDRHGLTVPVPVPTTDGRLFADGVVVMAYVEGGPPETEADWGRVAKALRQLHRLTQGWPQRPGWRSSTDLLHYETGTRIDLGTMPPEGVARCRAAWARLTGRQTCVVHGNPNNPGNVRMTADRVALIDWDESHVDVPDLGLVLLYKRRGPRRRRTRHRGASVSRLGSCRLLGRRVRSLAARRSTSDLSASRDRPADYGVRAQRQRRPCSADALIRRADRRATTSVRLGASARACGDRR